MGVRPMKPNAKRPLAILLAAGLALASPVFSKEKELVPPPPPMAMTGAATVFVDTPVEITLQIAGRIVEPLSFLIRKRPKHGTLGEVRRTDRNSATLVYTPDARTGPGDDSFSFAAQSFDGKTDRNFTSSLEKCCLVTKRNAPWS